jgi:putative tricarboxylic transport membrane protein
VRDKAGDIVSGIVLLALVVAIFVVTLNFPPPGQPNDPGTAAFPRIIAGALGVLALMLLVRPERGEPLPRGRDVLRVAGIVGLLLFYVVVLELLGFVLATIIFLASALLLAGARRPLALTLVPTGVSVVLYYVFYELLRVSLPRGVIEGIIF